MKKIIYQVTDPQGIHARPAGQLVQKISEFKCRVVIQKDRNEVNAKELLGVMSLRVKQGDKIAITFEGEEEGVAAKEVERFLKENY